MDIAKLFSLKDSSLFPRGICFSGRRREIYVGIVRTTTVTLFLVGTFGEYVSMISVTFKFNSSLSLLRLE